MLGYLDMETYIVKATGNESTVELFELKINIYGKQNKVILIENIREVVFQKKTYFNSVNTNGKYS